MQVEYFVAAVLEGQGPIGLWETSVSQSERWEKLCEGKENFIACERERETVTWPELHQSGGGIGIQQRCRGSCDLGYLRHATDRPLPRSSPLPERQTPEVSTIRLNHVYTTTATTSGEREKEWKREREKKRDRVFIIRWVHLRGRYPSLGLALSLSIAFATQRICSSVSRLVAKDSCGILKPQILGCRQSM